MKQMNYKKLIIPNIPYVFFVYLFDKVGQAVRLAPGADISEKILNITQGFSEAFSNALPSVHPLDLLIGIVGAVVIRLIVYVKGKNAKKYRKGAEYGSARWGNAEDIKPYIDPDFQNNIILTQTERLTMNSRPKQPKYARNKNVVVIGGSGSGKTRFFVKPNLMQLHSSYVLTDPKGTVLIECGKLLQRGGYKIKVLNTINFKKSMRYNPFVYIRSEKDVLKVVNTLIVNTKGEGEKSAEDFWVKAERLLYCALIGYIWYEAPAEEMNFTTLLELINASEAREDDEEYQSPVDLLFADLEERSPDHFAVKQYKKYKLAAGVVCSKRLLNQAVGKSLRTHNLKPKKGAQVMRKNEKITALYERLSRDDFGKDDDQQRESNSISNQKRILETYAKQNGFTNLCWYTDDGYSGANFQRPGFQAMLADIEAGKVGTVIVKDMSRLGRNYLQVGMYTEMLFPQKGVRFIAINDGVDSAMGDNDFTPLRNLFNEWMVRDTSKKIKAVKKAKGLSGKPVTSKPVYGYLMDDDENFIIDEEAAPVVKQIYQLCLAGNGPTKIARMLTEQQIPTPGTLEYRRTGSTRRYHPGYECKWATNTVVHILENREYTGCLVNFKTEKLSYKVKHSVENPPEKQVIFENHHEPIIDTQTWERVQELRKQRKRPNRYDEVGLFSGILFCADCGSVMYQQRYQTDKRKQDCYICGNYKKRTHDCTAHFIRTDLLTAGVLSNLRKVTSYAAKHEARFMKLLIEQNEDGGKRRNAAKKKELEAAEKRIAELSAIFKRLYEDSVTGRISDERFTELSADYEAEQRELKERAAAIQAELSKAQEATVNAEKFMNVVRRHTSFEELTPTLLREFVEKIVVHECSYDENKTRRQDIEIYYSFVGKVDLPE